MATRTRDSAPGKEKRGTSPSQLPNTGTTQRRRSPNPSKTNSPARSHESTASEKRIPNYLKPTVSSGLDVSKQQGKKPASSSDSTNHKPTLARRRSFDKPPSPSRTQISRVSPNPTLRSSSFSGKTITSQKVVPDKNLKAPKDAGKQHTLYARPVNTAKKSSIYIKKQETGSGSSTTKEQVNSPPEKVDNPNIPDVPEPEMQSKDQEPSIAEAEQTYEKEAEDSLLEDQEPINIEQTEGESDDKDAKIVTLESSTISENQDAKIVTVESPTVLEHQDAKIVTVDSPTVLEHKDAKIATVESSTVSEHQDVSLGVKTEKPEDKSHIEEISSKQQEIKEDTINEMNSINTDESVAGNPNEEVEEKEIEEEATALNKKEEAASGSEAHESKETEVQEVVVEEKPENVAPKTQVAHGKKDSAVSNDVIEETANKLREQRKNKVKALAGAFETVISLQEPK